VEKRVPDTGLSLSVFTQEHFDEVLLLKVSRNRIVRKRLITEHQSAAGAAP
jgi:hypothetical protein